MAAPSTCGPDPATPSAHSAYHQSLAAQVLHNLQYQHDWTFLRIHTHSSPSSDPTPDPQPLLSRPEPPLLRRPESLLPRPLLSGLPPQRVYVHPDEQVEMLTRGIREQDVAVEREWVLPTHVREKWSLRRFAEVFDAVGIVPPDFEHGEDGGRGELDNGEIISGEGKGGVGSRRGGKRVLLATVSDDSTVVYYVVHDGIVKPRQN
ncbi:hypothetical protein MMC07_004754 [Pseudocyphellaria aurata]|nr:hypothetical protein [Pseudocyphellaria aurata]